MCVEGFWDGKGRHIHPRKEDCFQYIYVSKVMTFQSLRCNMISFRVFEAQHQKTMRTVACYISWLGQTILAYFPLTSSLPDTPSHLWVAWGSGDLINSAPSLWSSFHLEIQNKEWVTGQLGWIRAPSSGDTSVSQAAHPGWVSSPGLWLHSLSRLSPVPRPPLVSPCSAG